MPTTKRRQFTDKQRDTLRETAHYGGWLDDECDAILTLLADVRERCAADLERSARLVRRLGDGTRAQIVEDAAEQNRAVPLLAPEGRADG